MEQSKQLQEQRHKQMLMHVFLPLELPSRASNTLYEEELYLLKTFNEVVQTFAIEFDRKENNNESPFGFGRTRETFSTWESIQENVDPQPVANEIKNLHPGHTFALYIKEQNCGLMVTALPHSQQSSREGQDECHEEEFAAISTFPVSLPCEKITEAEGPYAAVFPYLSVIVPKRNILQSKALARQLHDLFKIDLIESAATVFKSGHQTQETRDVPDPQYVTKWITGSLANRKSRSANQNEVPRVIKKIRDNVIFGNGDLPFRRSGLWMTMKIVLQVCLQIDLGKVNGTFMYKLILIKYMLTFLKSSEFCEIPQGLLVEMMAKIARRSHKLEAYSTEKDNKPYLQAWILEVYNNLMEEAAIVLNTVRKHLSTELDKVITDAKEEYLKVNLKDIKLWVHLQLKYSGFEELLNVNGIDEQDTVLIRKQKFQNIGLKMCVDIPPTPSRHRIDLYLKLFEAFDFHKNANVELGIVLYDFERSIVYWSQLLCDSAGLYVWDITQKYLYYAKEFYKGDPIGTSRMILTLMKIVQFWDNLITQKEPFDLLVEHRPGVDLSFTEDLVLPHKEDLDELKRLENYFNERETRATYPSLIEETRVSTNSFSARFAKKDRVMVETKTHIMKWGKEKADLKIEEVHIRREEGERLLAMIRREECEYITDNWKRKHSLTCKKCELDKNERNLRVIIFERPLPVGDENQLAVVFELLIPSQIAILRDLLYILAAETTLVGDGAQEQELYGPWSDYNLIKSMNRREQPWIVNLMSTRKLFLESHYKTLHPSNPDADFIKNNGFNCCYAARTNTQSQSGLKSGILLGGKPSRESIKNRCVFRVQKKSRYSGMQFGINGNELSANDVIAKQSECHPDLSLVEFIEFGSLRSEWKLQWRNIYRAISQCSLSLREESVFHLISQSIWQAGPSSNDNDTRDVNRDFLIPEFTQEFLLVLENIRQKHMDNWKDHYVLLNTIFIAQRISVLNPSPETQYQVGEVLLACRQDAFNWSVEIQRILSSLYNAPRIELDTLRIKLIEVNICIALTYRLNENQLMEMVTDGSFLNWLLAVARIHDNLVLLGPEHKLSNTVRNLLRRVDEIGVYIELFLFATCNSSDILTSFVEAHHNGSRDWKLREQKIEWKKYKSDEQVYFCEVKPPTFGESSTLQIDIIKGRFLVDGCPVGYLPASIENHKDFKRVFSTKSFEVQPYTYQIGRMITRDRFLGSCYSFYLDHDRSLTITEHRENDVKLELIPHTYFENNVPPILVQNYTHWYNYKTNQFEFFYRDPNSVSKLTVEKPEYCLELRERYLFVTANPSRKIIDVSCPGYINILMVVERLESFTHINMWRDENTYQNAYTYTVDMPRMGLQFTVRNVAVDRDYRNHHKKFRLGDILSKEYRGMRVSPYQENLKTLIGLKSGLLLEDADVKSCARSNSILLIPHGRAIVKNGRVSINMEEIRSPPFFAYEVDTRLKQLKAGESRAGWVYLAYLHAVTSQPIPDPFTDVTGTERALQILQTGQCWSNEPLDKETLRTLKDISNISPIRQYYPPNMKVMETVRWEYPTYVAHDAFRLIVDKLMDDSKNLPFLFPEASLEDPEDHISELELCVRGYWRRVAHTTELGRISKNFDKEYDISPDILPVHPSTFNLNFLDEEMTAVMKLAQNGYEWSYKPPTRPAAGILKNLLMDGNELKGIFADEGFPIKEAIYCWSKLDFRDYWLDLYKLAGEVAKKGLKHEWTLLLTYFAFKNKDRVPLDQLRILQTVAVNQEIFKSINPPEFEEYSMTNDYTFDRKKILDVIDSYKKPWEMYLDRNIDKIECYEDELQFADRLRPIHEGIVETVAAEVTDLIAAAWPIDSCDDIISEYILTSSDDSKEIELKEAAVEINILLKNWYKNRILHEFLTTVEDRIAILNTNIQSHARFEDVRLRISKIGGRSKHSAELEHFCGKDLYLINLDDVILCNGDFAVDDETFRNARAIFTAKTEKKSMERQKNNDIRISNVDRDLPEFPIEMDTDCPILREYMEDLEKSWNLFHKRDRRFQRVAKFTPYSAGPKGKGIRDQEFSDLNMDLRRKRESALTYWEKIRDVLCPLNPTELSAVSRQLVYAKLFPRILPLSLLPLILDRSEPRSKFEGYLRNLIGAYAVLVTQEQKAARCVRHGMTLRGKNSQEVELQAELKNKGHENWNPAQRPEWLLFEIEMDLMIRPIQAKVAEKMESPEENKNALIQLNMGEGKTYVIVPLLALSLADGKQLGRATVLKSLYQMNKNSLVSKIGGILLNRRVYSFPCRRDYKIGCDEAETILKVYEECVEQKGVVMTLPEHRLSFELKAYERCHVKNFQDARAIFQVQKWLKDNARDILDESDEILHVKYQLIYTLGKQLPVGGGSLRWTVTQDLLKIVPEQISDLLSTYGPSCLEYKKREYSFQFPFCRILKPDCAADLCNRLAQQILNGHSKIQIPDVTSAKKGILMQFLTKEQLNRETLNAVLKMYPVETHQETLLILRGFLACGVLCTSLTKRWRVNFGVNPSGYRRMAVPFRAKDVASERTEFGHSDVAIILTQLSYYYSGLSDDKLEHVFVILFLEPDPEAEYQRWISLVPKKFPGYDRISNLSGVNLNDFFQKTEVIFPAMRKNVATIDFWLGRVVFPQESKQFGWKIGCSPWDLSLGRRNAVHPTTGFSGTNDSKILLPKTISQKDLTELQGTNGQVLKNLLMEENDKYEELKLGITGKEILNKLVDANIRVLLDVGALMLELNNEQVAQSWLKLLDDSSVDVDAAVYFDENDKLVVLDRSGNPPCTFELSTFRTRLDRCVIYLDDVHTRGTDLKIPMGNEACVTLGKGVTKDKLVQGCMRMRKLGQPNGHKVRFWASQEVHNSIKTMLKNPDDRIGSREVLQWTIKNNQQQIKDGFIHWASAGVYQAQKLSSLEIYINTTKTDNDLAVLADNCSQKEQIDLRNMYGDVRTLQKFPTIVQHLLNRVNRELGKLIARKTKLEIDIGAIVEAFGNSVRDHSQKYVGDLMRSTQLLDEEQERELEHELEAQHQKQLPGKAKSQQHVLSEEVFAFIMSGTLHKIENWAVKLPLTLKSTNLWHLYSNDTWAKNVYATKDFSKVIQTISIKDKVDDFLRPVNWMASVKYAEEENGRRNPRSSVLLLLSPFEVNAFIDYFHSGATKASLHMFAPRVTQGQEELCENPALMLPYRGQQRAPFTPEMKSCLLMYSGSSYFQDWREQTAYCRFIGFVPRPLSEAEDAVFEEGGIVDGFLLNTFKARLPYIDGPFQTNPEKLIRGIIQRRFGSFSMDSHVGQIVFQCKKPFPFPPGEDI